MVRGVRDRIVALISARGIEVPADARELSIVVGE
jgi:hypothetical protein